MAERFANELDIHHVAYVTGLLHDLGKCHPDFQAYLENPKMKREVRDHSSAGAVYAYEQLPLLGQFVAWMVAGHHSGLADRRKLGDRLEDKAECPHVQKAIELAEKKLPEVFQELHKLPSELPPRWEHLLREPHAMEVWMRMLFSCLVDADYLDTEAHFSPEQTDWRASWQTSLDPLWERFERHQQQFQQHALDTPLNRARSDVYQSCLRASEGATGIFQLNVPTGMGKTLSGMGFALKHAIGSQKKRVIVVVPYSSILDQNAKVYQNIFGEEVVLEHHSAMEMLDDKEQENRRKLATENWDAPIVVTTTVQFFESLFARRTSKLRKLHHIANSVVILDEVQMLPLELLEPIFSVMRELTLHYNVTFLLSTATPLALDLTISKSKATLPSVTQVVPDAGRLFEEFRRVTFDLSSLEESWTWERTAEQMREHEQVMVIVNRRKDAGELFSLLADEPHAYHLSASMCPAHRKKVLQELSERLRGGLPVWLVATQVVEAGVDLDFPVVMRASGPLDRIVQAAGRCNREGRLERGTMIVFRPEDGGLPRSNYQKMTATAENFLQRDPECLYRLETFENYFRRVYTNVETDARKVEEIRQSDEHHLNFEEIDKRFRMIDTDTATVLVPYEEGKALAEDVIRGMPLTRSWMRRAQLYTVSLHLNGKFYREQAANLEQIGEGWYIWNGQYDERKGLIAGLVYEPDYLSLC